MWKAPIIFYYSSYLKFNLFFHFFRLHQSRRETNLWLISVVLDQADVALHSLCDCRKNVWQICRLIVNSIENKLARTMFRFSDSVLNRRMIATICSQLRILVQIIKSKAGLHVVRARRIMAMRNIRSLVHRSIVARLIRSEHWLVQEHEVLLRAFIKIDWVGRVCQNLTLLKVWLGEKNFIDLKQGSFIVNEEVQKIISINLGEFFKLDSTFGHLGQLAQSFLKLLATFQRALWNVTIERLADWVVNRLIDSGKGICNTSGA